MNPPNNTFAEIHDSIQRARDILIVSHVRPDGDAIGSQLALGLCLADCGKSVTMWNEDGVPELLFPLPRHELVTPPTDRRSFDLCIALDTATRQRIGTPLDHVDSPCPWINIDHHGSNPRFGDLNYVDSLAPATG